jgi:hypothetical protein
MICSQKTNRNPRKKAKALILRVRIRFEMSDGIFIVIATFGVVFVITAAMLQGLIITVDLLRAGFKGRRQSQVMVLLARFIVVPLVLVGLAAIVQLGPSGYGSQVDMAMCVIVLTAGPPFIPAIAKLAHGDIPYAASSALIALTSRLGYAGGKKVGKVFKARTE